MLFHFTTLDPTMPMFAPKVHPSSLVSYRDKNAVLKKLSEYFLQGKIGVEDIQQILVCSPDVWSNSLYNYLPEDEQAFHPYLNEKKVIQAEVDKSIAKRFLDEEITLKEYEDLRFPERKEKEERDSMFYPLPYQGTDCVICGAEKAGLVQCHTCDNMVCRDCMLKFFLGVQGNSKQALAKARATSSTRQSFLLMHHRYCMRLGALPEVHMEAVPEVGYLRAFRKTTRVAVLARFGPKYAFEENEYAAEYEKEEEERKLRERERRKREAEERERLKQLQNPPELQEKRRLFEERKRKFQRLKKNIEDTIRKLASAGHTDQFIARNRRLLRELRDKLTAHIQPAVEELIKDTQPMEIPGDIFPQLIGEMEALRVEVDALIQTSGQEIRPQSGQGSGRSALSESLPLGMDSMSSAPR
eukprot:scaffold5788_cov159-Ochromonas_danica.AAC.9